MSDEPKPLQNPVGSGPNRGNHGQWLTKYDPKLVLEILERVADGETLTNICKAVPGMPHPQTLRRWMVQYPEFGKAYGVAIQASATSLEDEALDAAREIARKQKDGTSVRAVEVKLGQLRWSMERRDPGKYGTRNQISVKVPVQIITPIDLNMGSAESIPDIYTLEAKTIAPKEEGEGLTVERKVVVGPVKRRRLVPPHGPKQTTAFSKLMRGITNESNEQSVWPGISGQEYRQQSVRSGDEGVHIPGSEEEPTHEEGGSGAAEDTQGSGQD